MEPFIGEIRLFAGTSYIPSGWLPCEGQQLDLRSNIALFAVIGNRFGGDGQNNFNLPDLRGSTALGYGSGPGLTPHTQMGQVLGAQTVTLTGSEIPGHQHVLYCSTAAMDNPSAENAFWCDTPGGDAVFIPAPDGKTTMALGTIGPNSGGAAHNNIQPVLVLRYMIATKGFFPTRD